MARFECRNEIASSYYILHTSDYYVKPDIMCEILQFENWGHEVGLHNDVLSVQYTTGENWEKVLQREIDYFRNSGIDVVGTTSHGSKEAYTYDFVNYDIFGIHGSSLGSGKDILGSETAWTEGYITLPSDEWGLEYEAYGLAKSLDWYVSDSGGRFMIIDVKNETVLKDCDIHSTIDFLKDKSGTIQLLIHPEYYVFD
jgi:hypothetical protein